MLQQSLVSLSMMMMQGLVNSYGKVLVAGYTAATKIDTLAMLPNLVGVVGLSGVVVRETQAYLKRK